jgi:hypothetical protein
MVRVPLTCALWPQSVSSFHPIGAQRTSVFLLLDADHLLDTKQRFRSTDFIHISWAMIPPYDHATQNA